MKRLLWIAIALLAVLGYAACGGGYSSPTAPTAPGTVGTPGPGPTPTPGMGD